MKKIYAREEYCLGCKLCEVYCVTAQSESGDVIKAHKQEDITSGIFIETKANTSFALQCRHCQDASCVNACISGAMQKDPETGVVNYDPEQCVGCWTCIMACPYGAVKRDQNSFSIISKCNLCIEAEGEPACVCHCPNDALIFVEEETFTNTAREEAGD